jgi:glycerol-3-phosphate dehydrogenase
VCGIQLHDEVNDHSAEVKAGLVINATGAWADGLRGQVGQPPRLRRLRGSHLIFPREKLPIDENISFLHPYDRRPVFAFPWEGVTLIGTTDVDHQDPMATNPVISSSEADYLMEGANEIFGCLGLHLSDAQAATSGVRSVLDTGKSDPSKEARDEILWDENGLITITGGKLTMYQRMARRTLRFARKYLPADTDLRIKSRALDCIELHTQNAFSALDHLSTAAKQRLIGRYGNLAPQLAESFPIADFQSIAETSTLWSELRWAAQEEQVVHLEDLLLRRTRLGIILPDGAADYLPQIRHICQPLLRWNNEHWLIEELAYRNLWRSSYSLPQQELYREPALG